MCSYILFNITVTQAISKTLLASNSKSLKIYIELVSFIYPKTYKAKQNKNDLKNSLLKNSKIIVIERTKTKNLLKVLLIPISFKLLLIVNK